MNSLIEAVADAPAKRSVDWKVVVAIVLAVVSMAVSGMTSYGHAQTELQVKQAGAATQTDLQPFRDKDTALSVDIATLKAQRIEDSNRLIRIEDKVDKLLQQRPLLSSRTNIPQQP